MMQKTVPIVLALTILAGAAQAQDAQAGRRVFAQCRGCHQVGPAAKNGIGPQLNGIIGRHAGTVPGYAYSAANEQSSLVWTPAAFADYIRDPKAKMPGTKMIFAGIEDETKIRDLTSYLETFGP